MAFAQPIPRPFTAQAIRLYAPPTSGVYGITNSQGWLHIGDAAGIQAALLAHLNDTVELLQLNPTGFVFEECNADQRPIRCRRLIAEYNPASGRQGALARRRSQP